MGIAVEIKDADEVVQGETIEVSEAGKCDEIG